MKLSLPCLTLACALGALHAEELSNSDKAKAVEWLKDYKEKISSGDSRRISDAKSALKRAASDDGAALELYKSSVKKTQFEENGKSNLDYITWEKGQKELFANPAFKAGLRVQCRWALISLVQADAEKKKQEIAFPIAEITSVYNDILSDPMLIRNKDMASGGQTGLIKKFLKVNDLSSKLIPASPFDVSSLFSTTLLPAIRKTGNIADYRKTWLWRIDLEKRLNIDPESFTDPLETDDNSTTGSSSRKGKNDRDSSHDKKKPGGIANDRKGKLLSEGGNELNSRVRLAREAKIQNRLSDLRWEMEMDCFNIGDQKMSLTALKAMLLATSDPELMGKRITDLTNLLTSSSESTPAIQSAGDKDMSGEDEWGFSNNSTPAPETSKSKANADTAKVPDKPTGPIVTDGISTTAEKAPQTPPAQPQPQQPDKAASEDDWTL